MWLLKHQKFNMSRKLESLLWCNDVVQTWRRCHDMYYRSRLYVKYSGRSWKKNRILHFEVQLLNVWSKCDKLKIKPSVWTILQFSYFQRKEPENSAIGVKVSLSNLLFSADDIYLNSIYVFSWSQNGARHVTECGLRQKARQTLVSTCDMS